MMTAMPYASERQRRYLHARHTRIAARWDAELRKKQGAGVSKSLLELRASAPVSKGAPDPNGLVALAAIRRREGT